MVTSNAAWSLKTHMRKLWADHVIWTREYLVAAIAATQDAQAAGNALTALLKQHILIAVDLIAAAKAGQQDKFQEHDQRWTQMRRTSLLS